MLVEISKCASVRYGVMNKDVIQRRMMNEWFTLRMKMSTYIVINDQLDKFMNFDGLYLDR